MPGNTTEDPATMYDTVKQIHLVAVVLTFVLFFIRGLWMLLESDMLKRRWVRTLPHCIDTTLLLAAIVLVIMSHQYPGQQTWLTAKIIALLVYISLGMVALKYGRTRRIRFAAWLGGQLTFLYIVLVALSKNPLPWEKLAMPT